MEKDNADAKRFRIDNYLANFRKKIKSVKIL